MINMEVYTGQWDLVDINGDGLPDYVRKPDLLAGETSLMVRLNLGYRFAVQEPWANGSILRVQQSLTGGLSTGAGITLPAIGLVLLALLPFLDRSKRRPARERPLMLAIVVIILVIIIFLTVRGTLPEAAYLIPPQWFV